LTEKGIGHPLSKREKTVVKGALKDKAVANFRKIRKG
jgi:hypothetical protein